MANCSRLGNTSIRCVMRQGRGLVQLLQSLGKRSLSLLSSGRPPFQYLLAISEALGRIFSSLVASSTEGPGSFDPFEPVAPTDFGHHITSQVITGLTSSTIPLTTRKYLSSFPR